LNTIIIEKIIDFIRFVGSGACHQNPQLSFFDGSLYMPVCSRCTGIYIGFIFSIIAILVLERKVKKCASFHQEWLFIAAFECQI